MEVALDHTTLSSTFDGCFVLISYHNRMCMLW